MFENCIAEDTCGDGTGCDNLTMIIVQLPNKSTPSSAVKRTIDEAQENEEGDQISNEPSTKRPKIDSPSE